MTITADQAKTLLDTATDGIWTTDRDDPDEAFRILSIRKKGDLITGTPIADEIDSDGDAAMILSAPDLARTVIDQAEQIERKKQALSTYGGVISTITRDLAKAIGHEDLLDEDGVHNQDIYEIAYEMIAEARAAREADQ